MEKQNPKLEVETSMQDPLARELELVARGEHSDPFGILGPHWIERDGKRALAIRIFRPGATQATIAWQKPKTMFPAIQIHAAGIFEVVLPGDFSGLTASQIVAPS